MEELRKQIKREYDRVNAGKGNWELYRQLQQELAKLLLQGALCHKGRHFLKLSRSDLWLLNKKDFPAGTVLAVGKYRIEVNGGKTTAYDNNTLATLYMHQMPQFLYRFVF
jgi:hypothetical protein